MAKRKTPARKGKSTRKKAKSSSPSGRMWLTAGILILLFIGILVFLKQHQQKEPKSHWLSQTMQQHMAKRPPAAPPKFEFYTLLPSDKERIPAATVVNTQGGATAPVESLTRTPATQQLSLLQVASFKSYQDADGLKAKLLLQGFNAHVEKLTNNGAMWYRVLVGPFADDKALSAAQKRMQAEHLDSIRATITVSAPAPAAPVVRPAPLKSTKKPLS